MKNHKYTLDNGIKTHGKTTESERFMYAKADNQYYILPTIGILVGGYPFKYRLAFAFGPWLFSIGFITRKGRLLIKTRLLDIFEGEPEDLDDD